MQLKPWSMSRGPTCTQKFSEYVLAVSVLERYVIVASIERRLARRLRFEKAGARNAGCFFRRRRRRRLANGSLNFPNKSENIVALLAIASARQSDRGKLPVLSPMQKRMLMHAQQCSDFGARQQNRHQLNSLRGLLTRQSLAIALRCLTHAMRAIICFSSSRAAGARAPRQSSRLR